MYDIIHHFLLYIHTLPFLSILFHHFSISPRIFFERLILFWDVSHSIGFYSSDLIDIHDIQRQSIRDQVSQYDSGKYFCYLMYMVLGVSFHTTACLLFYFLDRKIEESKYLINAFYLFYISE